MSRNTTEGSIDDPIVQVFIGTKSTGPPEAASFQTHPPGDASSQAPPVSPQPLGTNEVTDGTETSTESPATDVAGPPGGTDDTKGTSGAGAEDIKGSLGAGANDTEGTVGAPDDADARGNDPPTEAESPRFTGITTAPGTFAESTVDSASVLSAAATSIAALPSSVAGIVTTAASLPPKNSTGPTPKPGCFLGGWLFLGVVCMAVMLLYLGLGIDSNLVALGFILMVIVLIIAAWGWCVRRTERDSELKASLVEEDGPGYVAPHEVLSAGLTQSGDANPVRVTNATMETMGLHPMKMSRGTEMFTETDGSTPGHVRESQIDTHIGSNPFSTDNGDSHV